ncbi:MAG: orotate phosphoribosyltransferase [Armatimonadota bacterium]|nr:orotate phosphoribosyltransferase [bacterium]MDW8290003.1 orotate phosphoribosyltransferase [Armatimonadota bacterium]
MSLSPDDILNLFRDCGAVLQGHFRLSSGKHSDTYFEKFQVLQHPHYVQQLCGELAKRFRRDSVEVVVGPTTGGVIIAYEVARQLGTRAVYAEREGDRRVLRRGFTLHEGERVLVVDDILTTGGSVREVLEMLEPYRVQVVGVGVLVDRAGGLVDLGVRTEALLQLLVQAWEPQACPLCLRNEPITEPGSRFLQTKPTP